MTAIRELFPLNDFVRTVLLENVDAVTGVVTPITSGTIYGFLAISNAPTASEADGTLIVPGVYIGGANGYEAGTWLFQIDAAALTAALLASLFSATVPPYFIVKKANDVRVYEKLKYTASRAATIG